MERSVLKNREHLSVGGVCVCVCVCVKVQFFVTPQTVTNQALLPMKFPRQEYWSGLPCPSLGDLPNPGIKPRSPALQADSLATEPSGKPKNTGVDSLSLLQQTFPSQGSNPGLLHCRGILYQLSCQGSPDTQWVSYKCFFFIILLFISGS